MTFDNQTKQAMNSDLVREEARLPAVSSSVLFEIFPFIIVFGEDMVSAQIISLSLYLFCFLSLSVSLSSPPCCTILCPLQDLPLYHRIRRGHGE